MTKLNPTQQALLERAAQSDDGMIAAEGVAKTTVAALVRKGWMLVAPQTGGGHRLLITEAGRKASAVTPPGSATLQDPPVAPTDAAKPTSKLDVLADLLRQPAGATIDALMAATGWQAHSVRGAIAGSLKKRGLTIKSEKGDQGRVYRIEANV